MTAHASGDFETRSELELPKVGLHNYARHPSTDAWCFSYTIAGGPLQRWSLGDKPPADLMAHVANGGELHGWNVGFEHAIWNEIMVKRHGWTPLPIEQCFCTMAQGYAMSLPGALENAAPALGLEQVKDAAGKRLMLQMCRPRSVEPTVWWDEPEKRERLGLYCDEDVRTEQAVAGRLLPLPPSEQALWLLDQRINNRGIYVDLPAVKAAIKIVEDEQARLNHAMRVATKNAVATCNAVGQLGDWLKYRGVDLDSVAKADVLDALQEQKPCAACNGHGTHLVDHPLVNADRYDEIPCPTCKGAGTIYMPLPDDCKKALQLRQEAAKSSTAKLKKMLEVACADSRIRNWAQYHGAGTGRWAHRNIQPGNLPRPKIPQADIEFILDNIGRRDAAAFIDNLYGSVLDVISSCLRGFLCAAPGHDLIAVDYSNIEGRTLAWLAGEEWKLQAFRDFDAGTGPDLYLVMAAAIYNVPVATLNKKSPERQDGKTGELAFGYQGGVGAWRKMESTAAGVERRSDDEVNAIKDKWRSKHPKIVSFWYDLENAAVNAVRHAGQVFSAGHPGRECKFIVKGSFLWCKLPSGRNLCYAYPVLKEKQTPWGEMKEQVHYKCVDSITRKWGEASLYGGELSNNVTQAVARDLLAHAMCNLEMAGFPVVLHCHDEAVVEVKSSCGPDVLPRVEAIMKTLPVWAVGLPVAVEGWRNSRYKK